MTAPKVAGGGLTETQQRVMRFVYGRSSGTRMEVQIAGHGRGPWLSACRALVRKGLMRTWHSGYYGLTDEGLPIAEELQAARAAPAKAGGES